MNFGRLHQLRIWVVYLPLCSIAIVLFFWLSQRLIPAVPTRITITAGAKDGAYYTNALRYAQAFEAYGIQATVLESEGSLQNMERLRNASGGAQIGFLQGGFGLLDRTQTSEKRVNIQTIANVDVEPVWIFARNKNIDSLQQLQGLRVSIGRQGGGTRLVATKLLEQAKLQPNDLIVSEATISNAAKALADGTIDAVFFVASPSAPSVVTLRNTYGVHVIALKRSAALIERIPYLEPRLVAKGLLNTAGTEPEQDTVMLTTIASVVVREDLDPTIKRITAQIARQVHSGPGLFHKAGYFPNLRRVDFSSSNEARSTLVRGLPWIDVHFDVVQAQWLRRLMLIGVPMALLCWAMCSLIVSFIFWTLQSQINRWYGELKFIENDIETEATKISGLAFSQSDTQLRLIDAALNNFDAPPQLIKRLFILKQHTDFVRYKLLGLRGR